MRECLLDDSYAVLFLREAISDPDLSRVGDNKLFEEYIQMIKEYRGKDSSIFKEELHLMTKDQKEIFLKYFSC